MDSSLHIVLVEDDREDIDLLKEALRENQLHCEVNVFMQGDKLMPWLENSGRIPDVIVLDLNVPRLSGAQLLSALRSSERFRNIPVIVFTTSHSEIEKENCLKLGAQAFINKPTTFEGFNKAVSLIVESARGAMS